MADVYKILAQGQLPNAAASLYTPGGSKQAIVKHIRIVNKDSVSRTFGLYCNGTAAANSILGTTTLTAEETYTIDATLALASGDSIQGVASAATVLTYTIFGLEI